MSPDWCRHGREAIARPCRFIVDRGARPSGCGGRRSRRPARRSSSVAVCEQPRAPQLPLCPRPRRPPAAAGRGLGRLAGDPHRRLVRPVARARLGRRGAARARRALAARGSPRRCCWCSRVVAGLGAALVPVRPLPVWSATPARGAVAGRRRLGRRHPLGAGAAAARLRLLPPVGDPARRRACATRSRCRPTRSAVPTCWPSTASPWRVRPSTRPARPQHPSIQPQFPVGASAWYSVAWWVGGRPRRGLGARDPVRHHACSAWGCSPRRSSVRGGARSRPWAPVCSSRCVHVARSTYSEPVALPVLAAGLVALVLAARSARGPRRRRRPGAPPSWPGS